MNVTVVSVMVWMLAAASVGPELPDAGTLDPPDSTLWPSWETPYNVPVPAQGVYAYLGDELWNANALDLASREETSNATGTEPPDVPELTAEGGKTSFLPLLGDKARERGYALPLPFGIAGTFYYAERAIDVKSVRVGLPGTGMISIDDYLDFDVRTHVQNYSAKFDAWIFPFLNVYTLVGYMKNKSDLDILARVPVPGPDPPREIRLRTDTSLEGTSLAGGVVMAGGYKQFFATVDASYAYSDLDKFDGIFRGQVYGFRTGWNGEIGRVGTRIWVGGTYWDTERQMKGAIPVGGEVIRFDVVQAPEEPFNYNVGTNLQFSSVFNCLFDFGTNFDDATTFLASAQYRF